MARLTQDPITPRRSVSSSDSLTDLTRLLGRMQQSILHTDGERERRLRTSEHERNKASINLEYARTLLTKLEQDALAVKVHARRQEMQADLSRKRAVFEQLTERLRELEEMSIDSDEDDSDDGEDLLGDVIPTPSQSSDSRSSGYIRDELGSVGEQGGQDEGDDGDEDENEEDEGEATVLPESTRAPPSPSPADAPSQTIMSATAPPPTQSPSPSRPPEPQATGTATSSTLRPRGGATAAAAATDTATTTSAHRSQLFGAAATTAATATTTATAEAILDLQRAEQDKLTESMVSMAKALKASTNAFSSALREDQDVLAGAGRGLDRNERGLETVAGRMGTLRRLTEGEGWWGRLMLYAWIAGLAVFAVLLVFVLPKLRF
ncbi:putative synaptobrevin [Rosellinia necatrix]|uniref:Putative synaptobrevin n=1 Tax=Rosellinia necatrix TaxID=77044 RepID=A0A1W2TLT8_ROSNE|nr:putative synaptobrevin [Rosellinia necatrix]